MKKLSEDRERLQALAAFLPVIDAANFTAGKMVFPPDTPDGVSRSPYADASEPVRQFLNMLYEKNWIVPFDWMEWIDSREAKEQFAENGNAVGFVAQIG